MSGTCLPVGSPQLERQHPCRCFYITNVYADPSVRILRFLILWPIYSLKVVLWYRIKQTTKSTQRKCLQVDTFVPRGTCCPAPAQMDHLVTWGQMNVRCKRTFTSSDWNFRGNFRLNSARLLPKTIQFRIEHRNIQKYRPLTEIMIEASSSHPLATSQSCQRPIIVSWQCRQPQYCPCILAHNSWRPWWIIILTCRLSPWWALLNRANTAWFDGYETTDLNTNRRMHQHMHHRLCWRIQAISTFTVPPSFRIFR